MSDTEFDTALVTAAFRLAGEQGWRGINAAKAARAAGLPMAEARLRFPSRASILLRFGVLADQAALLDAPNDGPVRDRLFDLLMRRFDVLQAHRAGVKALLRSLPTDPPAALLLACATRRSMRWMLQGAGADATGAIGELQVRGLLAVWLWAVRAWERDESEDLSGTMAAVDTALQRAERLASWLHGQRSVPAADGRSDPAAELQPAGAPASGATGAFDADAPLPEVLPQTEDAALAAEPHSDLPRSGDLPQSEDLPQSGDLPPDERPQPPEDHNAPRTTPPGTTPGTTPSGIGKPGTTPPGGAPSPGPDA
jgi:ubiquinone biosynthesis protein COQ9